MPKGIIIGGNNVFSTGPRFPLAADKVNGKKFYVYHYGRVHVSSDGGETFSAAATLPNSYPTNHLTLETSPGKEGDIWIGMLKEGLFHSTDSGAKFTRIAGIESVPVAVRDAASGIGLSRWQVLRDVELPLASPVILAGVRVSVTIGIGTATIGSAVGALTFGTPIFDGLAGNKLHYVIQGAVLVALFAILTDLLFARLARALAGGGG